MHILLAEDSALLRAGLRQLLLSYGHEVTEVEDADSLRRKAQELQPDVIITDVRMPPQMKDDGLQAVYELRSAYNEQHRPAVPVVVLSQYVAASYLDQLMDHNGFAYLLKERVSRVEEFMNTVEEVYRGGTVVDPEVVSTLLYSKKSGISSLTPREKEVLTLMAQGLSNKDIESRLFLTAGAVSKHVANVFMKLGFSPEEDNRRVKAVLTWLRQGTM